MDNIQKSDVLRKNNCIINTGDNPTKDERQHRILLNKDKYGIAPEDSKAIRLPRYVSNQNLKFFEIEHIENDKLTTLEKLIHLTDLQGEIRKKVKRIESGQIDIMEYEDTSASELCNLVIIDLKILKNGKFLILNWSIIFQLVLIASKNTFILKLNRFLEI